MQNEPTDPQAELREQVEDMAMKYNIPLADLESLIDELLTTERERALKEYEDRDIEVELNTKQCLEVAQTVYEKYQEAMQPPAYAFYQFPDWLSRQLEALKEAPDAK